MQRELTYTNCKYFDSSGCPSLNNEAMVIVRQKFPLHSPTGHNPMPFGIEEINTANKLCEKCNKFTLSS